MRRAKDKPITNTCQRCGKGFYCSPSYRLGGRYEKKYCSQRCAWDSQQGTPEEFWAKVDKSGGSSACWNWTRARFKPKRNQLGYGRHAKSGKFTYAHRCAWMFANGEIPAGMHILHRCDNPLCCNPSHLFLGTHRENMLDRIAKGRHLLPKRVF